MTHKSKKVAKTLYLQEATIEKAEKRVKDGAATGVSAYLDILVEQDEGDT